MMRKILFLLLIASVIAGCSREKKAPDPATATATMPAPATLEVGKPAPEYTAQWLDGSRFNLSQERGNVVLVNLWATWCGPCRYEIPELQQLHDRFAAQRFKVIGVSVDEGSPDDVRQFVSDQKMTYPVALDPQGRLATLFDTTVLPTSAIIDRRGTVVWRSVGVVEARDQAMMAALERALKN